MKTDLGLMLADLRDAKGWSQQQLIVEGEVRTSRSTVANTETGRQFPDEKFWAECDKALDAEGELLTAYRQVADAIQEQKRLAAIAARRRLEDQRKSWNKSARPAGELHSNDGHVESGMLGGTIPVELGLAVNRRDVITSAAGFVAGLTIASPGSDELPLNLAQQLDQIAATSIQIGRRQRIGRADLVRLNSVHDLYQSLDHQYGGGLVYQGMNQVADAAAALLDGSYPDRLRHELFTTVANLRLLAGWTAFDMCDHSTGQRFFAAAERLAVATENSSLAVYVHYCQARQLQHLRHNRDAVEVLRLAEDRAGAAATPGTNAVINATVATSLAALGDQDAAIAALHRAEDEFDKIAPDGEPSWIGWIDRAELDAQFGRVYRDFARQDRRFADESTEWTRKAIEGFDDGMQRSSVLNQVGLCSAWFLAGNRTRRWRSERGWSRITARCSRSGCASASGTSAGTHECVQAARTLTTS
ncbi:hypothetical protein GCM10029992_36410 [Glycomyces albus]